MPETGLVIPKVPVLLEDGVTCMPKQESWWEIMRHWNKGAPRLKLFTPLKDCVRTGSSDELRHGRS